MGRSDSLFSLFDESKTECQQRYEILKSELTKWVRKNEPYYYVDMMHRGVSDIFNIFRDREAMDNKIIASAVIAYGKSRGNGNPHHLNHEALNLGSSEYFWTSFQKIFTTDGILNLVNFWTWGSTNIQSEMERNNAALIYNRLLNLIPWFRGAIKSLIAISFIFSAAALAFGALKPMIWWFGILMMEAVYGPASALVYHMSGLFIKFSDLLQKFQSLKFDPMMLIAAHEIDQTLAYLQTVYFIVQMVIVFIFCFGIMQSGWAIQKTNYNPNFGISQGVQKIKQAVSVFTKV
ncbi:MAG: hypothetical protein H6618_05050 [Deltaproteobacteria bacterium]|nr:hypothetical protein [Deltaproteobacteria bacterium]